MTTLREAAQQALEALALAQLNGEAGLRDYEVLEIAEAAVALEAALAEHFCDTHCTWADHAPGCVRAEPVQDHFRDVTKKVQEPVQEGCDHCNHPMYAAIKCKVCDRVTEPDLSHCPQCGGPADNGHDRSIPPNPYFCTKCMAEPVQEPALQTCNCRWDGEVQVQQCTLHEAHIDAIHEWAERAKVAEKKLAALAEPVQHLVDPAEYDDFGAAERYNRGLK